MRTALVSDMHGNAVAFGRCWRTSSAIRSIRSSASATRSRAAPSPAKVVALLRGLDCPVVLGNADAFVLDAEAGEEATTERLLAVREWTREQLGADGLAYVETFQPTVTTTLGGDRELLAFHGSPTSYDVQIHPSLRGGRVQAAARPADRGRADGRAHPSPVPAPLRRCDLREPGQRRPLVRPRPARRRLPLRLLRGVRAGRRRRRGGIEVAFRRVPFERNEVAAAVEESGMPDAADFAAHWRREPAGRPRGG